MMNKEQILERIQRLIRELFMDETIVVTRKTVSSDVVGWNSFEHINLLVSIEDEFNIRFDMSSVMMVNNVGELVDQVFDILAKQGLV